MVIYTILGIIYLAIGMGFLHYFVTELLSPWETLTFFGLTCLLFLWPLVVLYLAVVTIVDTFRS